MKCKEFIEYIERNEFEDFDLEFITDYIDKGTFGYATYRNLHVADVGYGDKVVLLANK
jgi:hypothetical protein